MEQTTRKAKPQSNRTHTPSYTPMVPYVEAKSRMTPRRTLKTWLPMHRLKSLKEGFYTDTFFSQDRSITGNTYAQIFIGRESWYTIIIPMKTKSQTQSALQDIIHFTGAPAFIANDDMKGENKGEWLAVCRTYCIAQCTTKPRYQNQNHAER
jgi:hypothetical protein